MSISAVSPTPPVTHGPVLPAGAMRDAVKESAFFALVALLLALPTVGLRMTTTAGLQGVDQVLPQLGKVALIVLLTFLARLVVRGVTGPSARWVLAVAGILTLSYALPWILTHVGALLGLDGPALEAVQAALGLPALGVSTVLGGVVGAVTRVFSATAAAPDGESIVFLGFCFFLAVSVHCLGVLKRARALPAVAVDEAVAGERRHRTVKLLSWGGILIALVLPFFIYDDRRSLDVAILLLTYVMLGWGLNIVVGLAGLLDLGYVAFYAVGAYSYALLAQSFGFGFWICLPLAGVLAAFSGFLLGLPVLRLRGDYFAIVTLGFGEIIRLILINWVDVTNGPNGIGTRGTPLTFFGIAEFGRTPSGSGLPLFHEMFGLAFSNSQRIVFLYYVILGLALIVNLFTLRIRRLPLGRAWEALREDDIACTSLGIDRTAIKLAAFTIAAAFGGFAGSFFAVRQGFISPESFSFIESAIILAIVVLGGMGSQTGVVAATLLVIGVPELFRELQDYRMMAFGLGMVLIMVWRPNGLLSHREPSIRLPKSFLGATSTPPLPEPGVGKA